MPDTVVLGWRVAPELKDRVEKHIKAKRLSFAEFMEYVLQEETETGQLEAKRAALEKRVKELQKEAQGLLEQKRDLEAEVDRLRGGASSFMTLEGPDYTFLRSVFAQARMIWDYSEENFSAWLKNVVTSFFLFFNELGVEVPIEIEVSALPRNMARLLATPELRAVYEASVMEAYRKSLLGKTNETA